jgi:hypothetical protein
MSPDTDSTRSAAGDAAAAPLDLLLTVFELIQYRPAMPAVRQVPLLGGGLVPVCDAPGTYVYDR